MQQQLKTASLLELEPISKEILFHSGEVSSRIFLPFIAFNSNKIRYHAKELDRLLEKVI